MDSKSYLTNKKFCPVPWTGFMYNFDGAVKHCIRNPESIGDLKTSSIDSIVTSNLAQCTRANMLNNQSGRGCDVCYTLEGNKNSFEIISDRVFYLKELKDVDKSVYSNSNNFDLATIDIRWSNVCNFACVYCNPRFSSRWAAELGTEITTPTEQQVQQLKDYILEHAASLKHVYMAGGEPLVMKENYDLLQHLKKVNPNVHLRVNTNLSKVDTRIFDLVCSFPNVHWTVSVESIEQEFEFIRYGGKWNDFLDNLTYINQLDHKISFNMLHFLLNYSSIFDCVDFLKGRGFHDNSFILGPLLGPEYLNVRHLPDHMLKLVSETIDNRLSKSEYLLKDGLVNMLAYIQQPFNKDFANSLEQVEQLGRRRNLDSREIFSSLYQLI